MWPSLYLLSFLSCGVVAIWPAPQSMTTGSSVVWIADNVQVTYNGASVCSNSIPRDFVERGAEQVLGVQSSNSSVYAAGNATSASNATFTSKSIVEAAIVRFRTNMFEASLVPWKLVARNELSTLEPTTNASKTYIGTLAITQSGVDTASSFKPLAGAVDESYNLTISANGVAAISAVSSTGVLHGLESFTQLFYEHSADGGLYTNLTPVAITDAPKFSHRGLNIDISRNWYPVEAIERTIDALAMNKFNRLHLHMTDAQSWPLDIPAFPELSAKGAYQSGLSYSPEVFAGLQSYATERGVETIVEFDMPGHTTSIGYSYPELIAGFDAKPWSTYCSEPPCGSLKLNSTDVYTFLDKLFADVLPRVSPYSAYFHTGGDEVNAQVYLLDETVRSNITTVIAPYIQKLVDRNHDQIRLAGLTPVVWEEMVLDWNVTLGKDVLVQTWLGDSSVAEVTALGYKALAGNYNYWYLDCGKGQWLNFDNGASFQSNYPFLDYCSPSKNWRLVYSYDPLTGVPANQTHLVQGGEVHIWSEQTDAVNLDDMVWPRASAAGEVLWSGRQDASGQNRSQITAAPRLAEMRERMVNRGIGAGPVQMVFCTQSNATECSL